MGADLGYQARITTTHLKPRHLHLIGEAEHLRPRQGRSGSQPCRLHITHGPAWPEARQRTARKPVSAEVLRPASSRRNNWSPARRGCSARCWLICRAAGQSQRSPSCRLTQHFLDRHKHFVGLIQAGLGKNALGLPPLAHAPRALPGWVGGLYGLWMAYDMSLHTFERLSCSHDSTRTHRRKHCQIAHATESQTQLYT